MSDTPPPAKTTPALKSSTQGPFTLWMGLKLSTMARVVGLGAEIHPCRWGRLAMLPGMGMYNSMMSVVENLRYGRAIRETEVKQPPIFMLGHWRSGSTLLHNLMTSDPQFSFVNLYQAMFPWHFLTTEWLNAKLAGPLLPKTRPMDNVGMGFDQPQEDELALCVMTGHSPYLLPVFQGSTRKVDRFFDVQQGLTPSELEEWKAALTLLIKKITLKYGKQVVLKSPSHTYRVKLLQEMYPGAKFVYIYRNPYTVYKSSIHVRNTMYEANALGKNHLEGIPEDVFQTYESCFRTYERDRLLVPEGNLHEVRFEDLEVDPLGTLQKMYEGLGLTGFEGLKTALAPQMESFRKYKKNKFTDDPAVMEGVYQRMKYAFDRYGYPPPHQESEPVVA
jgi:omega-hydroxy-beta-dihydromenaquinone-9 sulfotransferase